MSDTRHTVDPKFVMKRQGKDMVLYQGLLDAAHRAGLMEITTEILQYPCDENGQTTIVRAQVTMLNDGGAYLRFSGIGDANPKNVGGTIVPHCIRMAETRAKGRALRDALNVGMVTVEELGGSEDDDGNSASKPAPPPANRSNNRPEPTVDEALLSVIRDHRRSKDATRKAADEYMGRATTREELDRRYEDCRPMADIDRTELYRQHRERLSPPRPTPPPAATTNPFTPEQFGKTMDRLWELLEDGKPYEQLVGYLNAARPSMTAEQKEIARLELPKLKSAIQERAAPAIAG